MCKAMEEWAEELREEGEQLGMKNTLKLVAKMSQNGDAEYIARLMEPEVFEQMAVKYGMKAQEYKAQKGSCKEGCPFCSYIAYMG